MRHPKKVISGAGENEALDRELPAALGQFRRSHRSTETSGWKLLTGGTGPRRLVILPGLAGGVESMFRVQDALERYAEVTTVSAPGTLQTVEELVASFRSLRLLPAVLLGHSLGGLLAQCIAIESPGEVAGLVLANTGEPRGMRARLQTLGAGVAASLPHAVAVRLFRARMNTLLRPAADGEFWTKLYGEELAAADAGARIEGQLRLIHRMPRYFAVERKRPDVPVQMIAADDDPGFTREETESLAARFPKAQTYMLPSGTGHLSFLTRPVEFVWIVARFLSELG